MLFATTSNGVYCCDFNNGKSYRVLSNTRTSQFFMPEARGFFGIARHDPTGSVIVASRERSVFRVNKLANRVGLYLIDSATSNTTHWRSVEGVEDVHQIAWHDGRVFLTDTGKNRIVIYTPDTGGKRFVNVGAVRKDVNHINAVLVNDGYLYVGLSNRGVLPAALLRISLENLEIALRGVDEPDLFHVAEHFPCGAATYTHDLEPDNFGRIFFCVSYAGRVLDIVSQNILLEVGGWARGLAFGPSCLWVGTSELAGRNVRHCEKLDGAVSFYSWPDLNRKKRLVLHKAGQVNDLLYVESEGDANL